MGNAVCNRDEVPVADFRTATGTLVVWMVPWGNASLECAPQEV